MSQVLGVAAQRAITEMRKTVEAHVLRLPVRCFDKTQTGVLISRIMTDAEGIRNLVGNGLVQLSGSLVTAALAIAVLLYLNWRLTLMALVVLAAFGAGMAVAFTRVRPLFRERGKINAEVTGRLNESLGGIRIVKSYNFLFDGTIAQNIAYARPNASQAEIVAASRIAHCEEFVLGFPDQYNTVVGERSVRLSGGQRQRVAIARAKADVPPVRTSGAPL
jgi:ABC-type multidrug transport system fused ATPase/permease subunit